MSQYTEKGTQPMNDFIETTLRQLEALTDEDLPSELQRHIEISGLDFTTGLSSLDGKHLFIKPLDSDNIKEGINSSRYPITSSTARSMNQDGISRYTLSKSLWQNLIHRASLSDNEDGGFVWEAGTPIWEGRNFNYQDGTYAQHKGGDWKWCAEFQWRPRSNKPHRNCFLGHDSPLHGDKLTVAEVKVIFALTRKQRRRKELKKHHQKFPITVFSVSGTQVRILQAYIDSENEAVKISKTDIVDFSNEKDPFHNPSDNFITLMSWYLGEPIGDTN